VESIKKKSCLGVKRMKISKVLALTALLLAVSVQAEVVVSNVSARQIPGTKTVEINYDVSSESSDTVDVSLEVKDGDNILPATTLFGDIGANIPTGQGKQILWDAGDDWNGNLATLTFIVFADDGAAPPPIMPTGGDPTATSWEEVNERWVKNIYADGAITMSDRTTNLIWLYDASMLGMANLNTAKNICNNLTYAGHSDWFLPDRGQVTAMYSQKAVFINVKDTGNFWDCVYWSSTHTSGTSPDAFVVGMSSGGVGYGHANSSYWVWSCRPGQ
jgi:hypothetical protein